LQANDQGDYFPVVGICMGFQLLHILAADDYDILTHSVFKSESIMMPLMFTRDAVHSRLLASAPYVCEVFGSQSTFNRNGFAKRAH
jgi:gamma-glutamyl hydrolase